MSALDRQSGAVSATWTELEQHLRQGMKRSGIFKPASTDEAIQKIKSRFSSIDDLTCFGAIQEGRELTSEEKKTLGLSVRRKYLEDFIAFIDVANLDGDCPNVVYRDVYMDACLRTRRNAELGRIKKAGVKSVEILNPYGNAACSAVANVAKTYAINDAPALPLPGCDMEYCKCSYIPVQAIFDEISEQNIRDAPPTTAKGESDETGMIFCRSCGTWIYKAQACPHCGAHQDAASGAATSSKSGRPLLIGGLIITGIVMLLGVVGHMNGASTRTSASNATNATAPTESTAPAFVPDPRGVAMAKLMLLDDLNAYIQGEEKVVGQWSGLVPIDERVSARQLYVAYNNNEVSADERFKGKSILLTGVISKISKDFLDSVYLEIGAGGMFESVQAYLADESATRAGSLPRGARITLICTGNGMILTSPELKGCQTREATFASQRPAVESVVDKFFSGDGAGLPDRTKMMIGFGYVLGTTLPQGNACETADVENQESWKACTAALALLPKNASRASYAALAKQMALPPLPPPRQ